MSLLILFRVLKSNLILLRYLESQYGMLVVHLYIKHMI